MKTKFLNLLPTVGNLDLDEQTKNVITEALNKIIEDEELLKIAQQHYDNFFADNAPLCENVVELSEPKADLKLGKDMLFTLIFLAHAKNLEDKKVYTCADYNVCFMPTMLRFLKLNIQQNNCVGVTAVNRQYMYFYLKPIIFQLGRLAFEIKAHNGPYDVWQSKTDGSTIPLILCGTKFNEQGYPDEEGSFEATQSENSKEIVGYTYTDKGLIDFKPVTLQKSEYDLYMKQGDNMLSVHIPGSEPFTPDVVDVSFQYASVFFKKYFPQIDFKAYTCSSWLLDTGLTKFLKPTSNILSFQSRYRIGIYSVNKMSLFSNIFKVPNVCPLDELVPANRFQTEILQMIKDGGNLYSGYGYIIKD